MKIRNAFVSNSSSSSFVLALPRKPLSVDELRRWLFGDDPTFPNPYVWGGESTVNWPAADIAEIVYDDLKDQTPLLASQLAEEIESGWFEPEMYTYEMIQQLCKNDDGTTNFEQMQEMMHTEAERVAKRFLARWPNRQLFVVSYSDNDGELPSAMEHGDLFAQIPHITISHH